MCWWSSCEQRDSRASSWNRRPFGYNRHKHTPSIKVVITASIACPCLHSQSQPALFAFPLDLLLILTSHSVSLGPLSFPIMPCVLLFYYVSAALHVHVIVNLAQLFLFERDQPGLCLHLPVKLHSQTHP